MPDKANFTRAEASVQLALVKKGDYIARVADGFVCHARKSNQLGRLVISQGKFQPGKHYGFYWCGFRLWLVKEEIRQLSRGRIPYYMNHNRGGGGGGGPPISLSLSRSTKDLFTG